MFTQKILRINNLFSNLTKQKLLTKLTKLCKNHHETILKIIAITCERLKEDVN